MRSENIGSSPTHSAASSCSTMAATIGGVPRAAPMPVSPLSVSTNQAPPQVRTRLAPGGSRIRTLGPTFGTHSLGAPLVISVTLPCFPLTEKRNHLFATADRGTQTLVPLQKR